VKHHEMDSQSEQYFFSLITILSCHLFRLLYIVVLANYSRKESAKPTVLHISEHISEKRKKEIPEFFYYV
jgi:hypothetical protein